MSETAPGRNWGGKRPGAGRKSKDGIKRLRHEARPLVDKELPLLVTWRVRPEIWELRTQPCFTVLARAFWQGCNRFGFRLVHYSLQGNAMNLVVEADSERSLAQGMNGLGVRIARGLNRIMGRQGHVLEERYDVRTLKTRTEVQEVLATRQRGDADPYTSSSPLAQPETQLLLRAL